MSSHVCEINHGLFCMLFKGFLMLVCVMQSCLNLIYDISGENIEVIRMERKRYLGVLANEVLVFVVCASSFLQIKAYKCILCLPNCRSRIKPFMETIFFPFMESVLPVVLESRNCDLKIRWIYKDQLNIVNSVPYAYVLCINWKHQRAF